MNPRYGCVTNRQQEIVENISSSDWKRAVFLSEKYTETFCISYFPEDIETILSTAEALAYAETVRC